MYRESNNITLRTIITCRNIHYSNNNSNHPNENKKSNNEEKNCNCRIRALSIAK